MNKLSFGSHKLDPSIFYPYNLRKSQETNAADKVDSIKKSSELLGDYLSIPKIRINDDYNFLIFPFKISEHDEIKKLLEHKLFVKDPSTEANGETIDKWAGINTLRSYVGSSLNQGLFEIIFKYAVDEHSIIEIGSGAGYSVWDKLLPSIIRTQKCFSECKLLSESMTEPVYQMDIEEIYNCLKPSGIKISLFFALNVFDKLLSDVRKKSLLQISELQNAGDRLLIMLDTHPAFDAIYEKLENMYPDHIAMPYLPLTPYYLSRMSFVLVPRGDVKTKLVLDDYLLLIKMEYQALTNGFASKLQHDIHEITLKHNLKVIVLEDFFANQIKKDLKQVGYKTNVYYHTTFTAGKSNLQGASLDLIYKPVTDTVPIRQWSVDDKSFMESLNKKNIRLPNYFNENFISNLRRQGYKIMGAEILVVEATKIESDKY